MDIYSVMQVIECHHWTWAATTSVKGVFARRVPMLSLAGSLSIN